MNQDYYNGINLAYSLNVRANRTDGDSAIADRVIAGRVRREVIAICEDLLSRHVAGESQAAQADNEYWIRATLAEAYFGIGDVDKGKRHLATAKSMQPADWMIEAMEMQLENLAMLDPGSG